MASQSSNQQGTSHMDNALHDGSQPRFPGAAFIWRLMNSLKPIKTRDEVARWSFRFASKRKRGTARSYRKKEKQTDLEVINEERNIVADRFVLNPPTNNLNQMAAHITPQKKKAPEPAPTPTPTPTPAPAPAPAPLVFPPEPMPFGPTGINWGRIPSLSADSLRSKIQTQGEVAQNSMAHLFEEQERRRANHKYWLDMAKKRKREEEDAQWEKAEEERIKRVARQKTNPFADVYFPKPKSQRQQHQSTPQVSRTQPRRQTSRIRTQPRLMPSRVQSIQNRRNGQPTSGMTLRSGRMLVTNSGPSTRRWKCAVCCQTTACTRQRIYWKGNYKMIDLCLVCELRKNRGEILHYVEDNFSELDFDDSSSTTNTDTSSESDCVMVDVVNFDGQNNAQPAPAGGVDVQVQVDGAVVNANNPVVIVVPNVQQNVQPPVPAVPAAPANTYRDMFWNNNPLRQLIQQATSIDYSALFRVFVFGQPYLQVNVDEQQEEEQPPQPEQNYQPSGPAAAAPVVPDARQIVRPRQRRVQPPRQARAAQSAQVSQAPQRQQIAIPIPGARPAGIHRVRTGRQIPRVDPQDPRLFFGFLA